VTKTRERPDDPIGRVVVGNLRNLRRYRGWTQQQVADLLAPYIGAVLSGAAISQWEEGRNPDHPVRRFSISELWAICKIFEVNLSTLLLPGSGRWTGGEPVDAPTLFGESYFSVWTDCFAGIDADERLFWKESFPVEATSDSQPENDDWEIAFEEAFETIRRLKREGRI
jgi:transcriptional regulator with XRE-family HTH domain